MTGATSFPRRIAYVVERFPVLSQTFVASEVIGLRRRGVDVRIFALSSEAVRHRFISRAGLAEATVYGSSTFKRALDELCPELVHAHFATAAAGVARTLASVAGTRFTFTAHGYDIHDRRPADFLERAGAAAAVITVSDRNASAIAGFGVPRERIHVIPNGVDLERFRPAEDGDREPGLIVCVARHKRVKNLLLLLYACELLRRRRIAFRCVVIGEGRTTEALDAARSRLGLEDVVELAGAADSDEVADWWRRASIAALSSVSEGLPVALIEAGATAVPAVATRVGGIPEVVVDGETGLVVPSGDPVAFADALERLLANPDYARQLGRAARARAERHFSLERQVDDLLGLWATM